jgi:hypothetical protein
MTSYHIHSSALDSGSYSLCGLAFMSLFLGKCDAKHDHHRGFREHHFHFVRVVVPLIRL